MFEVWAVEGAWCSDVQGVLCSWRATKAIIHNTSLLQGARTPQLPALDLNFYTPNPTPPKTHPKLYPLN